VPDGTLCRPPLRGTQCRLDHAAAAAIIVIIGVIVIIVIHIDSIRSIGIGVIGVVVTCVGGRRQQAPRSMRRGIASPPPVGAPWSVDVEFGPGRAVDPVRIC
jgi:hypothetical protein